MISYQDVTDNKNCATHALTSNDYQRSDKRIGIGVGGEILAGYCHNRPAAIKLYWHTEKKIFDREVHIYEFITHFANKPREAHYLIQYYGYEIACHFINVLENTPPPSAIVMELADGGSLDSYLLDSNKPLSLTNKRLIIVDVTKGINALHHYGLVHNDIKSANVFLKTEGSMVRAKIGDFSSSKHNDDKMILPCTYVYASPEVLLSEHQDDKSDVYSMGMVVWEICANQCVHEAYENAQIDYSSESEIIKYVALDKKRLPIPDACSAILALFIERCWQHNPQLRPSTPECTEIARTLTNDDLQKPARVTNTAGTMYYHPPPSTNKDKKEFLPTDEYQKGRNSHKRCCTIL